MLDDNGEKKLANEPKATIARFWFRVKAEYCTCCCGCCAAPFVVGGGGFSSFGADFSMSLVAFSGFCAAIAGLLFSSAMVY